jgi:hypothetical protein
LSNHVPFFTKKTTTEVIFSASALDRILNRRIFPNAKITPFFKTAMLFQKKNEHFFKEFLIIALYPQ